MKKLDAKYFEQKLKEVDKERDATLKTMESQPDHSRLMRHVSYLNGKSMGFRDAQGDVEWLKNKWFYYYSGEGQSAQKEADIAHYYGDTKKEEFYINQIMTDHGYYDALCETLHDMGILTMDFMDEMWKKKGGTIVDAR